MNYKQEINNPNLDMGQPIEFEMDDEHSITFNCTKTKRIKITPFYTKRKNHPSEVLYKIELLKNIPLKFGQKKIDNFVCINENEPFYFSDKIEITKLWDFLQETFALEKETIYTVVTTDGKYATKEFLKTLHKAEQIKGLLDEIDLEVLNSNVSLRNLKALKQELKSHLNDNKEVSYWHTTLKKYNWILSQLFISPYIMFEDELYVGGKKYDRKGSIHTDFGMRNINSKNCAIIEIKTPTAVLVQDYRNDKEFRVSNELAGAISQVLKQRDNLFKSYSQNHVNSEHEVVYEVNNIKSILIIGKMPSTYAERETFENFRNELRNVEIITFDELLEKVQMQIDIIEPNNQN